MNVDLFSGPRGWSEGLRMLGMTDIGIECDAAACATAIAAGHPTIRADVATYPCTHLAGRVEGLIASPPCPMFSTAGNQAGRRILDELRAAISDAFAGRDRRLDVHRAAMATALKRSRENDEGVTEADAWGTAWADAREAALTVEPARWIAATRPRWVALEQVPAVLPLWVRYAYHLRELGYSAWAGILNAADYGVPQTRRRAILIASLDRPVGPPEPTHCRGGADTLFGQLAPWVSMAEALGWDGEHEPARTLCGDRSPRWMWPDRDGSHGRMVGFPRRDDRGTSPDGYRERDWFPADGPAPSLTEKARSMIVVGGINTGRDWKPGGSREDAQVIPADQPAPTVTAIAGSQWHLNPGVTDSQPNRRPYPVDEPAPTVAFGHDAASWAWERPATTLHCDPRVFTPGGHIANDGRDNSRMKGRSEDAIRLTLADALVLQSFRPDYPVQGNRSKQFEQAGNAVPPLLAAHIIAAATGQTLPLDHTS
jgi:DNA (cytosine-5)-methyltransferase 1